MFAPFCLPYLGSNSAVFGLASVAVGQGLYLPFLLHLAFLAALIVLAWIRGAQVGRKWLSVFPGLALVFDLTPGLNWIPMIPTTMHLFAIIIGVVGASRQGAPTGVYVQNRRTNEAPNYEVTSETAQSSPPKQITGNCDADQSPIGTGSAKQAANVSSIGKWAPVGLVCFSLIAGLLLFSIFGGFRKQPDVGISQFGALRHRQYLPRYPWWPCRRLRLRHRPAHPQVWVRGLKMRERKSLRPRSVKQPLHLVPKLR
jgi:hypothetical protein